MNQQKAFTTLLAISIILLLFNSYQISGITSHPEKKESITKDSQASNVRIDTDVLPQGVPRVYGEELGIRYDDVSPSDPTKADQTIEILATIDRNVELSGADLQRYTTILYTKEGGISCEYCCGARAIIFENGQKACGCAHSYAMRGLAKYLITQHGNEFTDDEILEEVGKWKTLFFPTQMQYKAQVMKEKGIGVNYITLATNKYRNIERGQAGSGMVGGC